MKACSNWMANNSDHVGDDLLSHEELATLLKKAGMKSGEAHRKAKLVCTELDQDGNGELDVQELQQAMRIAAKVDSKGMNRLATRTRLAPIVKGAAPVERHAGCSRWV